MFGRKWTALMLCLALMLPGAALAEENSIACMPGDTIDAVFQPVFPSGKPDIIVGQLEYDHDLFEGLFAGQMSVTPQGGVYMYNGNAVAIPFRVNRYAPAGTYTISVRVIEARDSQGKLMTDVTVLPVEVTVQKEKSVMPLPTAAPQPTASRPASPEKDFKYEIHDGKATVTGYSGNDEEVVIPDTLGGYPVEAIGDRVFMSNEKIISIFIPEGIKKLGDDVFSMCSNLSDVSLPDGLLSIGSHTFHSCHSLTSLRIPDGVVSFGDCAFMWCENLVDFTIPDSVTSVGDNPFCQCQNMQSITVSPQHPYLEVVDGVLFSKPDRRLIYYPQSIDHTEYSIPYGTKIIGGSAFFWNWKLIGIHIPNTVVTIEDYAIYGCFALTDIIIPDSVSSIGSLDFYVCNSLQYIAIPNGVKTIGIGSFTRCSNLKTIIVSEDHPYFEVIDGILYEKKEKRLFACPASHDKSFIVIPYGTQMIADLAFNSCGQLISIIIPDSVKTIGYSAFSECNSLESIHLPNTITVIREITFYNCTKLTDVNIPSGVTHIGWRAFDGCTSLRSLTIPKSVTQIDQDAFVNCSPDLVITVSAGSYALDFCKQNGLKYQIK